MRLRTLTMVTVLAAAGFLALGGAAPAQAGAPVTCGGQPATIVGTQGRDVLRGTSGNDVIAALGGDDVVLGLGGDDTICGGPGRDVVVGGGGHDACAGEVVRCESRVVGSPEFPFLIDPSAGPLVNGKTDNLVSVEFDGGGDVTTPLWVTIAFTSGATFTQTAPDHDWRCSPWTTGLGKPFTSAVACEYVGTTPDDPGNLVYNLAVNLPRPAGYIYALYCGSSTPGDFDNDSCTVPWIYMPVMRAT